jgi:hypothetical protein
MNEEIRKSQAEFAQFIATGKKVKAPSIRGVLIYGPKSCGKTRSSDILLQHFGSKVLLEEWSGQDIPEDTLALFTTNEIEVTGGTYFWDAMKEICERKVRER